MVRKAVKKARKWERWQDKERERADGAAAADRTVEPGGAKTVPAPAVLIDPRDTRRDCGLVNRAVRDRWPIGRSKARTIVSRLMGIVETREVLTVSGFPGTNCLKGTRHAGSLHNKLPNFLFDIREANRFAPSWAPDSAALSAA